MTAEARSVTQLVEGKDWNIMKTFIQYVRDQWNIEAFVLIGSHVDTGGLAVMEVSARVLSEDQVEDIVLNAADYIALVKGQIAAAAASYDHTGEA